MMHVDVQMLPVINAKIHQLIDYQQQHLIIFPNKVYLLFKYSKLKQKIFINLLLLCSLGTIKSGKIPTRLTATAPVNALTHV